MSRRPRAAFLAAAALTACGAPSPPAAEPLPPLVADPEDVSPGLPDAREVIERHLAAAGEAAVIESTRSTWARGRVRSTSPDAEGAFEVWRAKPDRMLVRMDFGPYGEILSGYDGEVAWTLHPYLGPLVHHGHTRLQMRERATYDRVLKPPELYSLLRTHGRERFGGEECWELQCTLRDPTSDEPGPTRDLRTFYEYYAVDSGLYVGSLALGDSPEGPLRETSTVTERQRFAGARLPTRIVQETDLSRLEIEIEEVRFGGVDEGVFALPPEIVEVLQETANRGRRGSRRR